MDFKFSCFIWEMRWETRAGSYLSCSTICLLGISWGWMYSICMIPVLSFVAFLKGLEDVAEREVLLWNVSLVESSLLWAAAELWAPGLSRCLSRPFQLSGCHTVVGTVVHWWAGLMAIVVLLVILELHPPKVIWFCIPSVSLHSFTQTVTESVCGLPVAELAQSTLFILNAVWQLQVAHVMKTIS